MVVARNDWRPVCELRRGETHKTHREPDHRIQVEIVPTGLGSLACDPGFDLRRRNFCGYRPGACPDANDAVLRRSLARAEPGESGHLSQDGSAA